MIKKYLLGLGIAFLGFLGFSNAQTVGNLPLSFYQRNTYNIIDIDLNFESIGNDDISYKSLYFSFSDGTKKYIFWNNGKIYFYNSKNSVQGFYDKVCLVPSDDGTWEGFYCIDYQSMSVFYNLQNPNFTNAWVYPEGGIGNLCFYDSNSKYYYCFNVELLTGSLNIPSNSSLFDISQYFGNSFFSAGNDNYNPGEIENITGDIVQVPTDIDRYIQYYESKYGRNESVCYVGTDNLTGAYGMPGLSFQYGSGATMFSLYYLMYGTFGQTPVKNVGHFLNCWLLNYNQWWDTISDERSYLCNYIGPSEGSVLTYDVTENPFKNNRAAIYFLIDNLYNHQYRIDTSSPMFESSMGDEYAFYCAAKLNYENYKNGTLDFSELENQIDPILKDIIGDWNNRNLGSQYGFSVPNMSGNDNIWGNLIQTGSGVPDDLNPSGLFKQFYYRINNLLQNFSPKTVIGFIPLWILYPMLFLILFRILRH